MKNFISLIFISLFLFAGCEEKLATLEAKNKLITGPSFDLALTTMPASFDDDATPDFIFAATNNIPNVDHYECSLNSAAFSLCTSPITLPTLAEGSHTFSVKAFDSAGKFEQVDHSWVVSLMDLTDLSYFSQEVSVLFSHDFNPTGGSGNYSFSLPTNPNGASINAAGIFSVTEATFGLYSYVVRVTDTTTSLYFDYNFNLEITQSPICVWTGAVDTDWANAGNWRTCSGAAPIATSKVLIGPTPNQPVISVTTTIDSFGEGSGGGIVTVNAGITLNITSTTGTISSDVEIKGSSASCANCRFDSASNFTIIDGATLTLGSGISLHSVSGRNVYVGNGVTAGHLKTNPNTATVSEWPYFYSTIGTVYLEGSASEKSSLDIDGLETTHSGGNGGSDIFRFIDHFEIKKFDNIVLNHKDNPIRSTAAQFVEIESCTNAIFTDTTWDGLEFYDSINQSSSNNIKAVDASCAGMAVISVSGSGEGFGSLFEADPHNKINWVNSTSFNCIWTGAVDNDWQNAGNWSACTNGRDNYPDQLDWAIIPVTGTMPVLVNDISIQGFGAGVGGGVIEVSAGKMLRLLTDGDTIQSDIAFKGSTVNCTNCYIYSLAGGLKVTNDAEVELMSGATLQVEDGAFMYFGDGVTGGHLKTNIASADTSEWPLIRALGKFYGIRFNGGVTESRFDVNGLRTTNHTGSGSKSIDFIDEYEITRLDKFSFKANYSTSAGSALVFSDCSNATFTDVNWDGLIIESPMRNSTTNINISDASCSVAPNILISGYGAGWGALFEGDDNSKLAWSDSLSFNCEWNGSQSSDWDDPLNWDNCINGRSNYPDQLDRILIPTGTPSDLVVTEDSYVYGFSIGVGGGSIEIINNKGLYVLAQISTIQSDVKLRGDSVNCSNCNFWSTGSFQVTDDAELELMSGITTYVQDGGNIKFGDGVTAGHLKTDIASADETQWPMMRAYGKFSYMKFNGGATNSSVNINGLRTYNFVPTAIYFDFIDFYTVSKFDRILFDTNYSTSGQNASFSSCSNAIFTDTTWDSLTFNKPVNSNNILISDASCSGVSTISITNSSGPGAGSADESDTFNIIDWL